MAIRSTTGVMLLLPQPRRELLLSKYITQSLATFGTILSMSTWKCPQKLYGLLLASWVRRLASKRPKTCGDPPFARHPWMSFPLGMEKILNLDSTLAGGMVVTQALMMGDVAA